MKPLFLLIRPIKRKYPYNNQTNPISIFKKRFKYQDCINLIKINESQLYQHQENDKVDLNCEYLSNGNSYYSSLEVLQSSFSFSDGEETHCRIEDYIEHVRPKKNSNIQNKDINKNENNFIQI